MNKKGKNKKGKVPIPPQEQQGDKLVLEVISDEGNPDKTCENVAETIESVKEERVPEIISEIIPPSFETKDEESPKKPRRNRGKKKKGKEDDVENNLEEELKESGIKPVLEEVNVSVPEVEPLDVPAVAPTIRKKKNKKKNFEQKTEEIIPSDSEQITSDAPTPDITTKPEVKQEIPVLPDSTEQDVKTSKKKNKKKKRNDSETCEKEEISCTTAFQKLTEAQDDVAEIKTEEKFEANIVPLEITKAESNILLGEDILTKEIVEKNSENQEEILDDKDKEPQQLLLVQEGKSKKKNKKDKKLASQSVENTSISKEIITNIPSALADNIVKDELLKDILEIEKLQIAAQETSPKPKAKIAKPVEKKCKGRQDNQFEESVPHDVPITTSLTSEEQQIELLTETKLVKKEKSSEIIQQTISETSQQEPLDINIPETTKVTELNLQEFQPLNISPGIGKKRKKGLKVPKTPDVSFEILEVESKQTDLHTLPSTKELSVLSETGDLQKEEEKAKGGTTEVHIALESKLESKPIVKMISQPDTREHVLLTPETLEDKKPMPVDTLTVQKKDDIQKQDSKSTKKRRKSPKPPQKDEHKVKASESSQGLTQPEVSLPTLELTKDVEEKIDASNITKIYDIEISSIKADESGGSTCEVTPDITYPRSISQQLMDNNNNSSTFIREIFPSQEIVLDTNKQENIETPNYEMTMKSKETVSPPKEEKTDIKSKMMEVNQDMEELRLSIERSLAELTAIEKHEEKTETSCEESRIKTEVDLSKITQQGTMLSKDDSEIMCQEIFAEKAAVEKPIVQTKTIEECETPLEMPLLILDVIQPPENIDIQKKDLGLIKSEPSISEKESTSKDIIIEESNNTSPTAIETKTDLIPPITEQKPSEIVKTKKEKIELPVLTTPFALPVENVAEFRTELEADKKALEAEVKEPQPDTPPVCPARKDHKNKHKKKKGKQDTQTSSQPTQSATATSSQSSSASQGKKKEEKSETKTEKKTASDSTKEKGKQQSSSLTDQDPSSDIGFEPIEDFEDALTSSVDDVNKSFELIVKETQEQNPKINITAPDEEKTPVSPPKNLLGLPDIPVSSNKRDYKKEKDKIPNEITATVKIKDAVDVEKKQSKNTQTTNKLKDLKFCKLSENEEFVYKYSFRKVFLQSSCHVCKKDLCGAKVPCSYCSLVFYCSIKHKDEDWPLHQALCFAVSTIGHLKDQKHIYADTSNITGQDYRLVRMQMIVSCEKVLKRRLVPWEQESLLYPRVCAHVPCREWRQSKLSDCQGCGQISFCTNNQDHYPKTHSRWCKSYNLYQKLVCYQQTSGRLDPRLPTKVMQEQYEIPENINEVLAAMYEEKIDMNDIQYAALTQLATAPLTAAYCYQLYRKNNITSNGYKKSIFTVHVVGAELQFEADALNKWEVFFLHLRPDLQELRVVLINYNLNPSNLPLELLGKIKLCNQCHHDKRRVVMQFQDKRTYADYKTSEDFIIPDLVCAFNPSIQRSSVYNGKDPWPSNINAILRQKIPFIITSYTITELHKDCIRIKECSEIEFRFISEPKQNSFASVRPDRNFITDDEIPLLFKNYCYAIICG